jgi:hypothetical protein
MHELSSEVSVASTPSTTEIPSDVKLPSTAPETVSTHVLVAEDQAERLRELSKRTRVAQSEYLREAVEDLLSKYVKSPEDEDSK